jgi:hypothetical protein
MIDERPSVAQQQNLLAVLGHDDQHGKMVAGLIDVSLFEADYRLLAERCIDYWRQHKCAPKAHLPDLLADILEGDNLRRAQALRYMLAGMLSLAGQINTTYVLNELQNFNRRQKLTDAIIHGAELLGQNRRNISAVEELLYQVLRDRELGFDRGSRLDDDLEPFFDWLGQRRAEFSTGIRLLDQRGIVPCRGALMLFIAGKGRGKTWWLISLGKQALLARKKVLHVSLENDEMETKLRYFMALFAASQREASGHDNPTRPVFQFDHDSRELTAVQFEPLQPVFSFASGDARAEVESRLLARPMAYANLVIKRFPNRALSLPALASYLDSLEQVDGFIPDLLLLDYAKLLKLPAGNNGERRYGFGDNMEALRALAVERNIAVATADQLNREGFERRTAHSSHIGEDWSQVHTADIVLTHSATDAEKEHGLARLYVDHARSERDKFGLLLAQSFATGQFALDSCLLPEASYYSGMMPKENAAAPTAATRLPPLQQQLRAVGDED